MSDYFELISKLQDQIDAFDKLLSGNDLETVLIGGIQKSTLSKAIKENLSALELLIQGRKPYRTKALMVAAGAPTPDALAEVWDDTPNNNGVYGYDGSDWVRSDYDPSRPSYLKFSGSIAPMQARSRDGVVSPASGFMNGAIIDARVIGAKPGKLYRIEWIGNGIDQFGDTNRYAVLISEYDESGYDIDSSLSKRDLHGLNDSDFSQLPVQGGVVNRVIKCAKDPSIIVSLSYMPSFFGANTQAAFNSTYSHGYSWVIDPVNYVELPLDAIEAKADSANLIKEEFEILPLLIKVRDGVESVVSSSAKTGIYAATVYGAKPGKLYRIEFIGGGVMLAGIARYDILIDEYDAANYETESATGRRNIIKLGDLTVGGGLVQPTGNLCIQTMVSTRDPSMTIVVVYDPSVISAGGQMILNSSGSSNYSAVIHPKFYSSLPAPSVVDISSADIESMNALRQSVSPLRVDHSQAGSIRVEFDHGDDRCRVNIVKAGANGIMALYSYDVLIDGAWVRKTGSSTDWIGPFGMRAVDNGNGNSSGWSGASHDASGGGTTGSPSAQTDLYVAKTEYGVVGIGDIVDCAEFSLTVENSLYAHNTVPKDSFVGRFVMKEVVHYTVKALPNNQGASVSVALSALPLELVEVDKYYGMQMLALGLDSYWFPGCSQSTRWPRSQNQHSGSKLLFPNIDRFTAFSNDKKFAVVGWLDPSYGLAKAGRPKVPDGEALGISSTYNKLYHQLIVGPSQFAVGEAIEWRGCYTFTPGVHDGDAWHHIMNTARGLYLGVESISAVDQYLSVEGVFRGKDVITVTKSDQVTDQESVSAVGLKLKSSGSSGATYKVV